MACQTTPLFPLKGGHERQVGVYRWALPVSIQHCSEARVWLQEQQQELCNRLRDSGSLHIYYPPHYFHVPGGCQTLPPECQPLSPQCHTLSKAAGIVPCIAIPSPIPIPIPSFATVQHCCKGATKGTTQGVAQSTTRLATQGMTQGMT